MSNISIYKLIIFMAMLFTEPGLAEERPLPRSSDDEIYFFIEHKVSEHGSQIARQENGDVDFVTINGNPVYFREIRSSVQRGPAFENGHRDGSKTLYSQSLGSISTFDLYFTNHVELSFHHGGSEGLTEGWSTTDLFVIEPSGNKNFICSAKMVAGGEPSGKCHASQQLKMSDLSSQVSERIGNLSKHIHVIRSIIKEKYPKYLSELGKIKDLIADLEGRSFSDLSEAELADLDWAVEAFKTLKKDVGISESQLEQKVRDLKDSINETRKVVTDELEIEGIDVGSESSFENEDLSLDELDIPILDDLEEEVSEENNPFLTETNELIANLNVAYNNDQRLEFLELVQQWNSRIIQLQPIIAVRSVTNPVEFNLFAASISTVDKYLYEAPGFINRSLWFKDSPVSHDIRELIETEIVAATPDVGKELLAEIKTWKAQGVSAPEIERRKRVLKTVRAIGLGFQAIARSSVAAVQALKARMIATANGVLKIVKSTSECIAKSSLAGDAGDLYEVITGRDICDGSELNLFGKVLSGVSIIAGNGKLFRVIFDALGLSTSARKAVGSAERIYDSAKKIGITRKGLKVYAKIHGALETLPNGLKAKRIYEGADPDKIAIIGRSMGNRKTKPVQVGVNDAASHLDSKGIKINTFSDNEAWGEFVKHQQRYNAEHGLALATHLPNNEVVKTLMYKRNKEWANKLVTEGYTIVDLGDPNGLNIFSPFYAIEKAVIFGN